jgi:hypothetical protein
MEAAVTEKAARRRQRARQRRDGKKNFRRSLTFLELANKEGRLADYERALRSWKRRAGCSGVPGIPVSKQERDAYYAKQREGAAQ